MQDFIHSFILSFISLSNSPGFGASPPVSGSSSREITIFMKMMKLSILPEYYQITN